ncbi:hypothetical protein DF121_29230 [Burkholderia stagnalis]|uniref:Uncharacterized protein n=1 Tax=Burkholderia stagnalis TaxID=1503054 RepID=A0A3N7SIQ0_9BURK|nr:hypothetical protein F7R25_09800 [Burkholderia stagnalis]RQQ44402.1 hypothetical protein DF145_27215 [Burkholderia stagnalis]RQX90605.1 hypothetical protein DF121_29230 [Burkholderia stagnalis]RQY10293.1 hypothetical protein DF115_28005 [Burkholderia stagnalis]RQY26539.1 hypothetical protein DF114_27055 [Burkholderia stagnalis]
MAGDRDRLQVDDARRVVRRRGSGGVHGRRGQKGGRCRARQKLCRARQEVRSFDNRRARGVCGRRIEAIRSG